MKRLLLDTHVFLWWIDDELHKKLGPGCLAEIVDSRNEVFVSAASLWEISIKKSIGSLRAPDDMSAIVERKGFIELPINGFHSEQAGSLPTS